MLNLKELQIGSRGSYGGEVPADSPGGMVALSLEAASPHSRSRQLAFATPLNDNARAAAAAAAANALLSPARTPVHSHSHSHSYSHSTSSSAASSSASPALAMRSLAGAAADADLRVKMNKLVQLAQRDKEQIAFLTSKLGEARRELEASGGGNGIGPRGQQQELVEQLRASKIESDTLQQLNSDLQRAAAVATERATLLTTDLAAARANAFSAASGQQVAHERATRAEQQMYAMQAQTTQQGEMRFVAQERQAEGWASDRQRLEDSLNALTRERDQLRSELTSAAHQHQLDLTATSQRFRIDVDSLRQQLAARTAEIDALSATSASSVGAFATAQADVLSLKQTVRHMLIDHANAIAELEASASSAQASMQHPSNGQRDQQLADVRAQLADARTELQVQNTRANLDREQLLAKIATLEVTGAKHADVLAVAMADRQAAEADAADMLTAARAELHAARTQPTTDSDSRGTYSTQQVRVDPEREQLLAKIATLEASLAKAVDAARVDQGRDQLVAKIASLEAALKAARTDHVAARAMPDGGREQFLAKIAALEATLQETAADNASALTAEGRDQAFTKTATFDSAPESATADQANGLVERSTPDQGREPLLAKIMALEAALRVATADHARALAAAQTDGGREPLIAKIATLEATLQATTTNHANALVTLRANHGREPLMAKIATLEVALQAATTDHANALAERPTPDQGREPLIAKITSLEAAFQVATADHARALAAADQGREQSLAKIATLEAALQASASNHANALAAARADQGREQLLAKIAALETTAGDHGNVLGAARAEYQTLQAKHSAAIDAARTERQALEAEHTKVLASERATRQALQAEHLAAMSALRAELQAVRVQLVTDLAESRTHLSGEQERSELERKELVERVATLEAAATTYGATLATVRSERSAAESEHATALAAVRGDLQATIDALEAARKVEPARRDTERQLHAMQGAVDLANRQLHEWKLRCSEQTAAYDADRSTFKTQQAGLEAEQADERASLLVSHEQAQALLRSQVQHFQALLSDSEARVAHLHTESTHHELVSRKLRVAEKLVASLQMDSGILFVEAQTARRALDSHRTAREELALCVAKLMHFEASLAPALSCTACCRLFEDPISLPCGHTFCRSCSKSKHAQLTFACLECVDARDDAPAQHKQVTWSITQIVPASNLAIVQGKFTFLKTILAQLKIEMDRTQIAPPLQHAVVNSSNGIASPAGSPFKR